MPMMAPELREHSGVSLTSDHRGATIFGNTPRCVDKLPWPLRIFLPGFTFAASFFFQNVCLHIATYYYVMWMHRLESDLKAEPHPDVTAEDLSARIETGALHDAVHDYLGREDINMQTLDMMSACLPAIWLVLVFKFKDWRLWTKCCICGSLLAIGKGVLAVMTVVPDSTGWEGCKARLRAVDGTEGYKYFLQGGGPDGSINFEVSILHSISDILHLEIFGILEGEGNRHLRYCADMIYSGHTYFATLFAVGIYDFVHTWTREHFPPPGFMKQRFAVRFLIGACLAGYVCMDVYCILLNRFHYSIDCVLAIWMVMLMYTNSAITMATDFWTSHHGHGHHHDFLLPPCCVPFCLFDGRYRLHPVAEEHNFCSLLTAIDTDSSTSSDDRRGAGRE